MTIDILIFLLVFFLVFVVLVKNIFVIQENQRLAVLKMGKLEKVVGPGLSFIIPFIDLGIVVDLPKVVPDWQKMTEEELRTKITNLVKGNPNPKAYE